MKNKKIKMNIKEYYRQSFWKTLPTKSYLKLLIAVFFTFSAIGFIVDLWSGAQKRLSQLFTNVLVMQNHSKSAQRLFESILNEVRQHGEQRDDQTMMVVRCRK